MLSLSHPRPRPLGAGLALLIAAGCAGGQKPAPPQPQATPPAPAQPEAQPQVLGPPEQDAYGAALERAAERLTAAQALIEKRDAAQARGSLGQAFGALYAAEDELPGEPMVGRLQASVIAVQNGGGREWLDALAVSANGLRDRLDPVVVALIARARKALQEGKRDDVVQSLRVARTRLAADLNLSALDQARERILAADVLLGDGRSYRALSEVRQASRALEQVRSVAPLVSVRWGLRAAALLLDRGDARQARSMVDEVTQRLGEIKPAQGSPLVEELAAISADARRLLRSFEGEQPPEPADLRNLAARTLAVDTG